jgi:hypothetical protein
LNLCHYAERQDLLLFITDIWFSRSSYILKKHFSLNISKKCPCLVFAIYGKIVNWYCISSKKILQLQRYTRLLICIYIKIKHKQITRIQYNSLTGYQRKTVKDGGPVQFSLFWVLRQTKFKKMSVSVLTFQSSVHSHSLAIVLGLHVKSVSDENWVESNLLCTIKYVRLLIYFNIYTVHVNISLVTF